MRILSICTIVAAIMALGMNASRSAAQQQAAPLNNCVHEFYDPGMYNWYSVQNTCDVKVNVTLIAGDRNPTHNGWLEISAHQKASTGEARSAVAAKNYYVLYACPAKYSAYESDGRTRLTHVVESFTCAYSGF